MIRHFTLLAFKHMFAMRTWSEVAWKLPVIYASIAILAFIYNSTVAVLDMEGTTAATLHGLVIATPFVFGGITVVSHLITLQGRLEAMAYTDQLTRLANRHAFFEQMAVELDTNPNGLLLLCDADRFKHVNDTFGHAAGDTCLCAIARHLKKMVPNGGLIARVGGGGIRRLPARPIGCFCRRRALDRTSVVCALAQ